MTVNCVYINVDPRAITRRILVKVPFPASYRPSTLLDWPSSSTAPALITSAGLAPLPRPLFGPSCPRLATLAASYTTSNVIYLRLLKNKPDHLIFLLEVFPGVCVTSWIKCTLPVLLCKLLPDLTPPFLPSLPACHSVLGPWCLALSPLPGVPPLSWLFALCPWYPFCSASSLFQSIP